MGDVISLGARDDLQAPDWLSACKARRGLYFTCTRVAGHPEPHVAGGLTGNALEVWTSTDDEEFERDTGISPEGTPIRIVRSVPRPHDAGEGDGDGRGQGEPVEPVGPGH